MGIAFEAWTYQVSWLELIAVVLALLGIGLGIKGSRWMWPPYFLSSVLYTWLFLEVGLLGSAGMQVIFIVAAVWGWFSWSRTATIHPDWLARRRRLLLIAAIVVAWLALIPVLRLFGDAASAADTFLLVGSFAAQVLMVLTKIDAWVLWIIVNVTGTGLYLVSGLYFTAIFYAVLVVMALLGLRQWQVMLRNQNVATDQTAPGYVHG